MAWLVQPAYAGTATVETSAESRASRDIVRLAADLVSTAALVETVNRTLGCQHRSLSKHRSEDPAPEPDTGISVSVNDIVARVTSDLPSLYLTASVNSVVDAIKPVIAGLRTHADTDRQTRISCREASIRHMRQYVLLRDQWDRSLRLLKGWPGADVRLIAQLDIGLTGNSGRDRQRVFARIDALGSRTAGDFGRRLSGHPGVESPKRRETQTSPAPQTPQRYF